MPTDSVSAGDGPSEPGPARTRPAKGGGSGSGPQGAADRVAKVHRQARPTFVLAAMFGVAAPVAGVIPHETGVWLPLHLFLVGSLLGAIVAATQLLAVTWSASPAPSQLLANTQRVLLFGGTATAALGRELDSDPLVGIGGGAVIVALALLIVSLVQIRRGAVTDRYGPAIFGYCVSAIFGIVGTSFGTALASGAFAGKSGDVRGLHIAANALGLVGIVIASTLPYFVATQARMKMSKTATPGRVYAVILALAASTIIAMAGSATGADLVAAIGQWAYAASVLGVVLLMPRVGRKQLDWAGPRLVQLAAGFAWWVISVVLLGITALTGSPSLNSGLRALVVGGYAQILFASLAYFAPVILAGKRKPGDGLRITRSWISVGAANIAALGGVFGSNVVMGAGLLVWMVEAGIRLARLGKFARAQASTGNPSA